MRRIGTRCRGKTKNRNESTFFTHLQNYKNLGPTFFKIFDQVAKQSTSRWLADVFKSHGETHGNTCRGGGY